MMLRTLLESQPSPNRRTGGTIISIAVHTGVIALAVAATARATAIRLPGERINPPPLYVVPPTPQHHESLAPRGNAGTTLIVIVDKKVLIPPIDVPKYIPVPDHSRPPVDAGDFSHGPITLGGGGRGPSLTSGRDSVYTPTAVEKAAAARPDNPAPVYPSALRAASVEGSVIARFVVDTLGRAEPASIGFPAATHEQFADAVRQALLRSRYLPAMIGGRPVRQLVEQKFEFTLRR
jgi:protein TonB